MIFRKDSTPGREVAAAAFIAILVLAGGPAPGVADAAEPQGSATADAGGPQRLKLSDAVRMALAENSDIKVISYNPKRAMEMVKGAESAYDPSLFAAYSRSQMDRPVQSTLDTGFPGDNLYSERRWSLQAGVKKPIPWLGGVLTLSQTVDRLENNSSLTIPNPQNTSRIQAQLSVPVLQGGLDAQNRAAILLSKANAGVSDAEFRQKALEVAADVVRAYWELVFHREVARISGEILGMAEEVHRRESVRHEKGLSKSLDVERARAAIESRRGELVRARNRLEVTTQQLRLLINDPAVLPSSRRELVPLDAPVEAAVAIDVSESVLTALAKRPEVFRAGKATEAAGIRKDLASNKRLPKLDAKASYTLNALGKSYPDAMSNAYTNDYTGYSVGLEFEWPIGNQAPDSEYRRAVLEKEQQQWDLQRAKEQVASEVYLAEKSIRLSREEIESAKVTKEATERVVVGQKARFELGQTTNEELLRAQDSLAAAEREVARALVSYNVGLAALSRARGTMLEEMGIEFAK